MESAEGEGEGIEREEREEGVKAYTNKYENI
jgi:hypothetical protein